MAELNSRGRNDLIAVDHLSGNDDPKKKNLAGKRYHRYYDKAEYLKLLKRDQFDFDVECILHMGLVQPPPCRMLIILRKIILNTPAVSPNGL
jgi:hypothetical protein